MSTAPSLVAGNWKMNGFQESISELKALISGLEEGASADCGVLICPPATLIAAFATEAAGSAVAIGAQDCHTERKGAHTGDISASMVKDSGATYVIVGHSERRADHGESDRLVSEKAKAAVDEGLTAIICVGETEQERDEGHTIEVVTRQVSGSIPIGTKPDDLIIAYEPVWAIGTGRTPTPEDVADVHKAIRDALVHQFGDKGAAISILYGGSVKPSNAVELMAVENVNGALVGGASLKASDFLGIIAAYQ